MRRILTVLLTALLLLALAACSGTSDTPSDTPSDSQGGSTDSGNNQETPPVTYTITWYDENGAKLGTTTVNENTVPSYTYTVTDTQEWDYTLDGWSATEGGEITSIPAATADASYYASVSKVKQKYTLTFNTLGGSEIDSVTVEYGTVVDMPAENPTYDGHKFLGWSASKDSFVEIDPTAPLTENKTYYAVWNEVVDIKAFLKELLDGYSADPYSYLPETLVPGYGDNRITASEANQSYASFVNVSDILSSGYGEQWTMILDNIEQSKVFFTMLSAVETLTSTSLATFNNYLDSNPADTAHHNFASGIYSITLDFDGDTVFYVLDYTATIPVIGEETVQIALSMNVATKDKTVRIQLGDANALTYTVTENSYTFAIKYLGVRRAVFSVARADDGSLSGSIYEHLTVSSVDVASAAEFYVSDGFAYAVGNKADGLLGFTGYISEVYDVNTGKMVGYEVMETLSSITYNTLWFNLSDIDGIDSVKIIPGSGTEPAKVYVNGSSTLWSAKKVGVFGGLKAASRRFDIELRTQYFYTYDAANKTYVKHAVDIPMLFVQEEYYDDFVSDVKSENKITVAVDLTSKELSAMLDAYDNRLPTFIEHKDLITSEIIIALIGEKIKFED